jgi:penicillin-binding protein 1A
MSAEDHLDTPPAADAPVALLRSAPETKRPRYPPAPPGAREQAAPAPPESSAAPIRPRRRLRKLRFLAILLAGLLLSLISFLYGMFMAVTSDLPRLDERYQFTHAKNSILLDDQSHPLGVLSEQHRILLAPPQIPRIVKDAVVAIEDKRFYNEPGIDPRGVIRAALQDVLHQHSVQGASTIAEQFVKNALQAQSHRTVFEKLREAALAFQLTHKWPKEKILTEYLNTIYFGEGAYGIESAAETYFGQEEGHVGCGLPKAPLCVAELKPWEAAMLAGVIASPARFNPVTHPQAAKERRAVVLKDMFDQHYITLAQYQESVGQPLPSEQTVQPPQVPPVDGLQTGYFTSWVEQQLIERYGAQRALEGGLTVHTTLDLELQRAAENAVNAYLPGPEGPSAAMVVIENSTGDVRAMVGGHNYDTTPFDLATAGERQPGSAFKAFDLATALQQGISLGSVWTSSPKVFTVPGTGGHEKFYVHNDLNAYAGSRSLLEATTWSDNSVFAEVGIDVGTGHIAATARRMGIRTPISTNPAMAIGGLKTGVTPIDMAHAYETLAENGQRVGSSMVSDGGPNGIQDVAAQPGQVLPDGQTTDVNRVELRRVLPPWVASEETSALETVVAEGTGHRAAIGQFAAGKTGTTSNFGDAWFVGWSKKFTVAVWVGYPTRLISMSTDYAGGPVEGGTFPALIWHDFMVGAMSVERERAERAALSKAKQGGTGGTGEELLPGTGSGSPSSTSGANGGSNEGGAPSKHQGGQANNGNGGGEGGAGPHAGAPAAPAPSAPQAAPSQPPASESPGAGNAPGAGSPPTEGGGSGGGGGAGGGTPSATGGSAPPGG